MEVAPHELTAVVEVGPERVHQQQTFVGVWQLLSFVL
jgi:hypothetical protein